MLAIGQTLRKGVLFMDKLVGFSDEYDLANLKEYIKKQKIMDRFNPKEQEDLLAMAKSCEKLVCNTEKTKENLLLSRERLMNLEAGEEMDLLVLEYVMGLNPDDYWIIDIDVYSGNSGNITKAWLKDHPEFDLKRTDGDWFYVGPEYSTDIVAAWEVVEKLRDDEDENNCFVLERNAPFNGKNYACRFGDKEYSHAEEAPLAICRAALKSVVEEKESIA